MGISFRELDKLVEIFDLAERFTKEGLKDLNSSITWARELYGVSKKLLVPTVIDAVVDKVARKRITNSKDLRKLRAILPDRSRERTSLLTMVTSIPPCFVSAAVLGKKAWVYRGISPLLLTL